MTDPTKTALEKVLETLDAVTPPLDNLERLALYEEIFLDLDRRLARLREQIENEEESY